MTDTDSKTALAAAQDNETKARQASERAAQAVRTAQAARDSLIGDAAAGKAVKAQDVRAAEEATRAVEIDAEIAARVHTAAIRQRHEAEIAVWWAEANEIRARIDDAAVLVVDADDVVKAAEATLRQAEAERDRKLSDYVAAHRTGENFNHNVGSRNLNPVLAALDSGVERPRVRGARYLVSPEFAGRISQPAPSVEQAREDVAKAKSKAA